MSTEQILPQEDGDIMEDASPPTRQLASESATPPPPLLEQQNGLADKLKLEDLVRVISKIMFIASGVLLLAMIIAVACDARGASAAVVGFWLCGLAFTIAAVLHQYNNPDDAAKWLGFLMRQDLRWWPLSARLRKASEVHLFDQVYKGCRIFIGCSLLILSIVMMAESIYRYAAGYSTIIETTVGATTIYVCMAFNALCFVLSILALACGTQRTRRRLSFIIVLMSLAVFLMGTIYMNCAEMRWGMQPNHPLLMNNPINSPIMKLWPKTDDGKLVVSPLPIAVMKTVITGSPIIMSSLALCLGLLHTFALVEIGLEVGITEHGREGFALRLKDGCNTTRGIWIGSMIMVIGPLIVVYLQHFLLWAYFYFRLDNRWQYRWYFESATGYLTAFSTVVLVAGMYGLCHARAKKHVGSRNVILLILMLGAISGGIAQFISGYKTYNDGIGDARYKQGDISKLNIEDDPDGAQMFCYTIGHFEEKSDPSYGYNYKRRTCQTQRTCIPIGWRCNGIIDTQLGNSSDSEESMFYLNEPDSNSYACPNENDPFPDEIYCMPQLQERILTWTSLGLTMAVILASLYIAIVLLNQFCRAIWE